MDPGLLIAQVEHGPQLHGDLGPILLVALVLFGGLAYIVSRARRGSERGRGLERDPGSDRGPEASTSERDPRSDRGPKA